MSGRARVRTSRWAPALVALALALGLSGGPRTVTAASRQVERWLWPAFTRPAVFVEPPAPVVVEERVFPFLPGEDHEASRSVGDTSHGFLVNATPIEESAALAILPEQKKRDLAYGSRELVSLVVAAAEALHAATGTKLWIGNVARRTGGDISWSVSHNSGRDADIAFAYTDHRGRPADPPDLVPLNEQGLAKHHNLRFDAARTWIVVKALLTHPAAQPQYLFLSSSLKNQLLMHAASAGEPGWLIERAATVLRQPGGSAPHHDHLHLRIYCTERDVEAGCVDSGVVHPWARDHGPARKKATKRFVALLDDGVAESRRRAIERLALLDAREQASVVARRLSDDVAAVRAAAARALAQIGDRPDTVTLALRFATEADLEVRLAILNAIGTLGGKAAGLFLAKAIGAPTLDYRAHWPTFGAAAHVRGPAFISLLPEAAVAAGQLAADHGFDLSPLDLDGAGDVAEQVVRLAAIEASSRSERLEPVAPLVELLTDRDPNVRLQAAEALRMITNLSYHVAWNDASPATRAAGLDRWRAAYARGKTAPRRAWLVTGFQAAGYRVPELRQKHAWELVRAIAGADHNSYNAQRVLMELFDHHPPSLTWSKPDACDHWLRFIRARRSTHRLERPPEKTLRACY